MAILQGRLPSIGVLRFAATPSLQSRLRQALTGRKRSYSRAGGEGRSTREGIALIARSVVTHDTTSGSLPTYSTLTPCRSLESLQRSASVRTSKPAKPGGSETSNFSIAAHVAACACSGSADKRRAVSNRALQFVLMNATHAFSRGLSVANTSGLSIREFTVLTPLGALLQTGRVLGSNEGQ